MQKLNGTDFYDKTLVRNRLLKFFLFDQQILYHFFIIDQNRKSITQKKNQIQF